MPNSTVPANVTGLSGGIHRKEVNMGALKIKEFPGLQRIAPETIEKHEMEQQLRDAQFALDVQLHDLRSEFLQRESKLRQDYLDRVAEITAP
jgi:hypothetical protein